MIVRHLYRNLQNTVAYGDKYEIQFYSTSVQCTYLFCSIQFCIVLCHVSFSQRTVSTNEEAFLCLGCFNVCENSNLKKISANLS